MYKDYIINILTKYYINENEKCCLKNKIEIRNFEALKV